LLQAVYPVYGAALQHLPTPMRAGSLLARFRFTGRPGQLNSVNPGEEIIRHGDVRHEMHGISVAADPARDERFWTQVCNARVSDRIGDIPLMRVNAIHHTIALVRAPKAGIQHINHQVESSDDVLRSYYFLSERRVPIVFGPGRHPTSGARFLYFKGPDGMIFEYSVGVDEIEDEATHRPRQFGFEPTSFCMWGSKPAGMALPNN
jgi:catechol 2,3-dioxygenase-like lactoylglutathione lyase family enzyme